MIVDFHAHLDDQWERNLGLAHASGVNACCASAMDLAEGWRYLALAERHESVWVSAGMHPWNAHDWHPELLQQFAGLWQQPKVRAIGEIGLDFVRGKADQSGKSLPPPDRETQLMVFESQVDCWSLTGKPLVIHERGALVPVLEVLDRRLNAGQRVAVHGFQGDLAHVVEYLARDLYVSIGRRLISNLASVPELSLVIKRIPQDRLLLETDSATPHRLLEVAEAVAVMRQEPAGKILAVTGENAAVFYGA